MAFFSTWPLAHSSMMLLHNITCYKSLFRVNYMARSGLYAMISTVILNIHTLHKHVRPLHKAY